MAREYAEGQTISAAVTEMTATPAADAADLMVLAMQASDCGATQELIGLLEQVLALEPEHAAARHLLAAAFAQIGRIDEALAEFEHALERNPTMAVARFQYGLLLFSSGKMTEARDIWSQLASLGKAHVLNRFAAILECMQEGRLDVARRLALSALADNKDLPVINVDLQLLLDALPPAEDVENVAAMSEEDVHHVLLSSYAQPDSAE